MADHEARSAVAPATAPVPTVRWEEPPEGPVVVLLDQTRLPAEESAYVCTDAHALVEAIRTLVVRGAPVLGIAGAYGVALAAARGFDVDEAAEALAGARPTAVNLAAGVRRAHEAYRRAVAEYEAEPAVGRVVADEPGTGRDTAGGIGAGSEASAHVGTEPRGHAGTDASAHAGTEPAAHVAVGPSAHASAGPGNASNGPGNAGTVPSPGPGTPPSTGQAPGAEVDQHPAPAWPVPPGSRDEAGARAALAAARALHREDAQASDRMAGHGLALLGELLPGGGHRILTHCNTGALVSGGRGTAFAVALAAHEQGRLRRLWVDETRPLLQGARLTAWEAARAGMPYTLLTDNAAGSLFAAGEVDAVLVGADRIAADGSVANKVGTYPLAVLARYHHVPFIVVAPVTTVDPETPDGAAIEVEQRGAHEVTEVTAPRVGAPTPGGGGIAVAPVGTAAYNPAFDVTPPELVTAIVTERGVLSPVTAQGLAELCAGPRPTTIR